MAQSTYVDKETDMPLDVVYEHVKCKPIGDDIQLISIGHGRKTEIVKLSPKSEVHNNPKDISLMSKIESPTRARNTIQMNSMDIKNY